MNQARYESLPKDLRAVIDKNAGPELAKEAGRVWMEAENLAIAAARANGNTINVLQDEEQEHVRTALGEVLKRWASEKEKQGLDGLRLIREARQIIGLQSKKVEQSVGLADETE